MSVRDGQTAQSVAPAPEPALSPTTPAVSAASHKRSSSITKKLKSLWPGKKKSSSKGTPSLSAAPTPAAPPAAAPAPAPAPMPATVPAAAPAPAQGTKGRTAPGAMLGPQAAKGSGGPPPVPPLPMQARSSSLVHSLTASRQVTPRSPKAPSPHSASSAGRLPVGAVGASPPRSGVTTPRGKPIVLGAGRGAGRGRPMQVAPRPSQGSLNSPLPSMDVNELVNNLGRMRRTSSVQRQPGQMVTPRSSRPATPTRDSPKASPSALVLAALNRHASANSEALRKPQQGSFRSPAAKPPEASHSPGAAVHTRVAQPHPPPAVSPAQQPPSPQHQATPSLSRLPTPHQSPLPQHMTPQHLPTPQYLSQPQAPPSPAAALEEAPLEPLVPVVQQQLHVPQGHAELDTAPTATAPASGSLRSSPTQSPRPIQVMPSSPYVPPRHEPHTPTVQHHAMSLPPSPKHASTGVPTSPTRVAPLSVSDIQLIPRPPEGSPTYEKGFRQDTVPVDSVMSPVASKMMATLPIGSPSLVSVSPSPAREDPPAVQPDAGDDATPAAAPSPPALMAQPKPSEVGTPNTSPRAPGGQALSVQEPSPTASSASGVLVPVSPVVKPEPVVQVAPVKPEPVVQVAPVKPEPVLQVVPVKSPVVEAESVMQVVPVEAEPVVQVEAPKEDTLRLASRLFVEPAREDASILLDDLQHIKKFAERHLRQVGATPPHTPRAHTPTALPSPRGSPEHRAHRALTLFSEAHSRLVDSEGSVGGRKASEPAAHAAQLASLMQEEKGVRVDVERHERRGRTHMTQLNCHEHELVCLVQREERLRLQLMDTQGNIHHALVSAIREMLHYLSYPTVDDVLTAMPYTPRALHPDYTDHYVTPYHMRQDHPLHLREGALAEAYTTPELELLPPLLEKWRKACIDDYFAQCTASIVGDEAKARLDIEHDESMSRTLLVADSVSTIEEKERGRIEAAARSDILDNVLSPKKTARPSSYRARAAQNSAVAAMYANHSLSRLSHGSSPIPGPLPPPVAYRGHPSLESPRTQHSQASSSGRVTKQALDEMSRRVFDAPLPGIAAAALSRLRTTTPPSRPASPPNAGSPLPLRDRVIRTPQQQQRDIGTPKQEPDSPPAGARTTGQKKAEEPASAPASAPYSYPTSRQSSPRSVNAGVFENPLHQLNSSDTNLPTTALLYSASGESRPDSRADSRNGEILPQEKMTLVLATPKSTFSNGSLQLRPAPPVPGVERLTAVELTLHTKVDATDIRVYSANVSPARSRDGSNGSHQYRASQFTHHAQHGHEDNIGGDVFSKFSQRAPLSMAWSASATSTPKRRPPPPPVKTVDLSPVEVKMPSPSKPPLSPKRRLSASDLSGSIYDDLDLRQSSRKATEQRFSSLYKAG